MNGPGQSLCPQSTWEGEELKSCNSGSLSLPSRRVAWGTSASVREQPSVPRLAGWKRGMGYTWEEKCEFGIEASECDVG